MVRNTWYQISVQTNNFDILGQIFSKISGLETEKANIIIEFRYIYTIPSTKYQLKPTILSFQINFAQMKIGSCLAKELSKSPSKSTSLN